MSLKILLSGITLGFADGILNPCTISVILFLITYLISLGANRKRLLKSGLSFVFGVALTYLIFMLALLKVLNIALSHYGGIAFTILGIIAIVLGLIEIKDFFWYGKGVSLKIPEFVKPKLQELTEKATIFSSFLLGIVSSLAEIPCAGFFPFAYTTLVTSATENIASQILYVLWYIIFFATPLSMIVVAVYVGLSYKSLEQYYEKGRRWMRLIAGLLMIMLGILFLAFPETIAKLG